jgi:membrane-bound lytic murein transglycosylase B
MHWVLPRVIVLVLASSLVASSASGSRADFAAWLAALGAEALDSGISEATVTASLGGVEPLGRILELDRSQPRSPAKFCEYFGRRLTSTRIERGRRMLHEHRAVLDAVSQQYGVAPRFVIALWGLETNFGDYTGDYRVIDALATLAYDERRGPMFRRQLLAALRIVDQGHQDPGRMKGSWAGAMGQVQFMPTTFLDYAVDHDGDGRKDVWESLPDAFASAAHYLDRSGWNTGQTWGREVTLPAALALDSEALGQRKLLADWQAVGVRKRDGSDLPQADLRGSIVMPSGNPADAYLVYHNFRVLLRWNNSNFFGISVGSLADELSRSASAQVCRTEGSISQR